MGWSPGFSWTEPAKAGTPTHRSTIDGALVGQTWQAYTGALVFRSMSSRMRRTDVAHLPARLVEDAAG
jgi:hypothetical protein